MNDYFVVNSWKEFMMKMMYCVEKSMYIVVWGKTVCYIPIIIDKYVDIFIICSVYSKKIVVFDDVIIPWLLHCILSIFLGKSHQMPYKGATTVNLFIKLKTKKIHALWSFGYSCNARHII